MAWEAVIGLEVHVQLNTQSKIFSGAATAFGAAANSQVAYVDLGLPGTLPVLNKAAVIKAIQFGLAVNATINPRSVFARKNYFYPDLPKGYQISQYEEPIVKGGALDINLSDGRVKTIELTRAHLEEDAGKLIHDEIRQLTAVDLNRAGTPLLEIVTEPVMHSAEEAVAYLKTLHALVRYLGICDGNMQEGSFRCDANVSVRQQGETKLGVRTELKNINSFRFVERAINYEIGRHIEVIEDGGSLMQETRLYDADRDQTRAMRSKENANDYRYFPDPDLLPLVIDDAFIAEIKRTLPELPAVKQQRFSTHYQLNEYDARLLTADPDLAQYFEAVLTAGAGLEPKLVANWLLGDVTAALSRDNITIANCPVSAAAFTGLLLRIKDNTISQKIAKTVLQIMWQEQLEADVIITRDGLTQMRDATELTALITAVIAEYPQQVADYRAGKTKLLGFLVGQVMQRTQGKADPEQVNQLLMNLLK